MNEFAFIRRRMRRREYGPRFVTFSCQDRLPLLGRPGARETFVEAMRWVCLDHGVRLIAWVVMPEHVHLLLPTPRRAALGKVLSAIKQSAAQRIVRVWRGMDAPILQRLLQRDGRVRFWQAGGGFDRNVRDDGELCRTIRYIHLNPVERGLVNSAREWEWSSVRWWGGESSDDLCEYPLEGAGRWASWRGFE